MQEQQPSNSYLLFTYRSKIDKVLPTTYYDTDAGWGCMLRVGQMAIANYLHFQLGIPIKTILKYCWDNSNSPFSIQQVTNASRKLFPQKKPYDWYNPSEMSFIMKELIQNQYPEIHVKIFLDNSIFLQEIPQNYDKLLIIVLIRIGLEEPEQIYLPTVDSLMNNKYFFAALGGTPKHAHLFLKSLNNQIGYLDPHKTLKSAKSLQQLESRQAEYISKLSWIKSSKIDSSMGMIFKVGKQEILDFWTELERLKQKHKQNFFIYMDNIRPEIDEDALIEISDYL